MKALLELRPALDGHAGIPQETRLLFRGLNQIPGYQVDGLIQSSNRVLARALPANPVNWSANRRINQLSRLVVSLHIGAKPTRMERLSSFIQLTLKPTQMLVQTALGLRTSLQRFEPEHFRDFIWRALFAKTLPHEDFDRVTQAAYRVARVPWSAMHAAALLTRRLGHALYPRLDTRGYDVMVAETPYPGRVTPGTQMVVRYHDAIPLLMPHTISDRAYHQASHYAALRRNVADGAWFACVSDATWRDLISVFPECEARSVVVHNMISHHYFAEATTPERIPEIVNTRRNMSIKGGAGRHMDARDGVPPFLLMVSTIEPRKNHLTLLAAWEQLRTEWRGDLQLVLVGSLGWESKGIVRKLRPWLDRGGLHMLEDVPSAELRLLYRHAAVTVCPSFGEGFDFSGVEAMRCGGVVAGSDIPVHHEVFGDAFESFTPYSSGVVARVLHRLLVPEAQARRAELVAKGAEVAAQYMPDRILPQWQQFLGTLAARKA